MSNSYKLKINENKSLSDRKGRPLSWISGQLSLPSENKMIPPDVVKLMSNSDPIHGLKDITISLNFEKELYMLPLNADSGVFFGSDIVCGRFLYGKKEHILKSAEEIEEFIIDSQSEDDYQEDSYQPVLAIWHIPNGESLLTLHHDSNLDIDLPEEITEKPIINIPCGAFSDDMTAEYMLTTIIYKWIKKVKVNNDDVDMEDFEDDDDIPADADTELYVSFGNDEYSKKQKDLFINLSKLIFCDIMHWDTTSKEISKSNSIEAYVVIANKLKNYKK